MFRSLTLLLALAVLTSCYSTHQADKIHGVNLEMPPDPIEHKHMEEVKNVHANWVAVIPYAFTRPDQPEVRFQHAGRWWGESVEGTAACIRLAHEANLKVMMKPHIWVAGQGWAGDFEPHDEAGWKLWEASNRAYILTYAHLADSLDVALFCIGTEYRKTTAKRPDYWRKLIQEVRTIYDGPVTYAANWDEYANISFWDELDYIGVDAYFPLSTNARPSLEELNANWQAELTQLEALSIKLDKPVLFTEYGYRSIEYTNSGHWNYHDDTVAVSMDAQATAYEALFQSAWDKEWMAGGFFWKWHFPNRRHQHDRSNDYTPQGKKAEEVIKKWYGRIKE